MSYEPRAYNDIVRDLLTTLTGGTVREIVTAPATDSPLILEKLRDRPVRRISHLEGKIAGKARQVVDGKTVFTDIEIPYKFTPADFELVSTTGDENNKDSIRFREGGRRPIPGSKLVVNYYPVQTNPVPLTDLNVGSVIRTLLETTAREMAMAYQQLDYIYKSAYLETAEGSSLDKVVALVGITRLPAGHPVVNVRFSRSADVSTQVTVPVNTAITDAAGNRYLTLSPLTLEPGESTRDVLAQGETPGTKLVEAGQLNRLEVLIAGISQVTNPQPARALNAPETDDDLRRRASGGLRGVVRGTVDALKFNLLSIDGVKAVNIVEAPNGIAGEIRIEVAYANETPELQAAVDRTIQEIRPAGIRVIPSKAKSKHVNARVQLTLAGARLPAAQLSALQSSVEDKLFAYLSNLAPGGKARRAQMTKLVLDDTRITDAHVTLIPAGESEVEELSLDSDTILEVVRPFNFPPPTYEQAPGAAPATTTRVSLTLPIHLVAGITLTQASSAINLALDSYLRSRRSDSPFTVDGLAAAIRDDTRFALVRNSVIATVESDGRFLQLTDGVGQYAPASNETLQKDMVNIVPREGGV